VRESRKVGEHFLERIMLSNTWLPWRSQDMGAGEAPTVTLQLKWMAQGQGKQLISLVVQPWLAYGCSVGARLKTASGYMTVVSISADDTCDIVEDNAPSKALHALIDPRPDTVTRTLSPSYKPGQKLLLLHEGGLVDGVVEEWMGDQAWKPTPAATRGASGRGGQADCEGGRPERHEPLEASLPDGGAV